MTTSVCLVCSVKLKQKMVNDSKDMRLKRSFKNIVIDVVFFFVIKAYNLITKPKSKLSLQNSIVLQADSFDDK